MNLVIYFYLAGILFVTVGSIGTIRSAARLGTKIAALVMIWGFMISSVVAVSELSSRPKRVDLEWAQSSVEKVLVLSSRLVEGQAIYLWLLFPGTQEPRYYAIPWDQETAEDLQKAIAKAEKEGSQGVVIENPFQHSWSNDKMKIYPLPQPKLPEKLDQDPPMQYNNRMQDPGQAI